jgi:hypothetical protein
VSSTVLFVEALRLHLLVYTASGYFFMYILSHLLLINNCVVRFSFGVSVYHLAYWLFSAFHYDACAVDVHKILLLCVCVCVCVTCV